MLEAQDAVRKLKAAYMQGLDDRLRGQVADLFWPEAIWESLPFREPDDSAGAIVSPGAGGGAARASGQIVGRDAIAASFVAAARSMSFTAHFLTNESITVTGDRAAGCWKLLQACTAADGPAFWQAGVYTDDFECRGGVWKFAHLRLALDFRAPYDQGWQAVRRWPMPAPATT